ncbi:Calcineurin-binding protein cabin-1 [Phytophthora boehmeriae]|uniref:Calcineurin-binding protein cabin-1 n=1 Tax=Phytophthora boehmeriae TaxID=109152 RepID=A0A8T1VY90_9STRA|nr:Calcineurin-binding protein cabin-1 [Phytophthora boehmeriae]
MYGQALRCQQLQQVDKAKHIYQELLNGNVAVNSRLEYLCNKNLATMEFEDHMYEAALQYFAEALALDATDVVVWYQMATTAIETGKLWLARRTLEEGIKVDSTYWPLVETLAEVLHEIGDIDEYERMAAYIRANDPQCASIRIIDDVVAAKRGDVSDSTGPFEAKKKRPRPSTRDLKLLNRAQRRLDHLREIAESSAKRRKLLHEELSQELETAIMPRQYQLQSPSWMTLGKLLLEAFEDVNRGATTNVIRATVGIGVSYERQQATSAIAERPCTDSVNAEVEQKIGNTSLPDETNISRAQKNGSDQPPPAKCTKDKELVSFPSCVDPSTNAVSTGASDNDTQESVHTSEVDDLQPIRRKSRRNEERQREEHAAAIKKAREKDLAYRLGAFIPKNVDDAMSEPASLKWLLPLRVEFIGTEFRVLNESNEVIAQGKVLRKELHLLECWNGCADI